MGKNQRSATLIFRTAVAKASWRIFPLLGIAYLIASMDRLNVSFAATRMNHDLGFSATVYGLGAGMFFLSYALFEIPSNLLLLRFGARRWIARIMITWGLFAAGMMFVRTPLQFYVMRFLIGFAEAGFFPGALYYLSQWFPSEFRARAISRFYLFGPLSVAVMGLLSGWLLSLDGTRRLHGWQWLFLVEGLPAVVVGLLVLRFLPDAPASAPWLSAAERDELMQALERDTRRMGVPSAHNILIILRNPLVRMLSGMYLLSVATNTTFNLTAPLILIAATGRSVLYVGGLVSLGGLLGAAAMLLTGWFADRRGERFMILRTALVVEAIALLTIAFSPPPGLIVVSYLAFAASWTVVALMQATIWVDVLKNRQLAIGAAAINSFAQMGAFFGSYAFGVAKDASGSYSAGLLTLPAMLLVVVGLTFILQRQINGQVALRPVALAH